MKQSVTVPVSDETQYDTIKRQLSICLDNAPKGCDRPEIKNSLDDDRLAAVLVPLIWCDSGWQILMTKRRSAFIPSCWTNKFPGGVLDAGDKGLIDTALREAYEEISLTPTSLGLWAVCSQCEAQPDLLCSHSLALLAVIVFLSCSQTLLKSKVFLPFHWHISASLIIFLSCRARLMVVEIVIG